MSDPQLGSEATPDAAPTGEPASPIAALTPAPDPERRAWATRVITEILQHLGLPSRVEAKDAADGGIAVALHFEEPVPGVAAGRRSHFVDSLQFLVNKIVNRPSTERRWVSIGVGDFPEPRQPRDRSAPRAPRPVAAVAQVPATPAPTRAAPAARPQRQSISVAPAPVQAEERTAQVSTDAALESAVRRLAEKSAALGRFYAIAPMTLENRTRTLRAASGVAGVKVDVEGEGRNRRVVFTPDKPAPMPKKAVPDYGDDDEDL